MLTSAAVVLERERELNTSLQKECDRLQSTLQDKLTKMFTSSSCLRFLLLLFVLGLLIVIFVAHTGALPSVQGIILVYDITNMKSFDNITKWLQNIEMVSTSALYYACIHLRLISVFKSYYAVSNLCS